jgi:hypothetical protein
LEFADTVKEGNKESAPARPEDAAGLEVEIADALRGSIMNVQIWGD